MCALCVGIEDRQECGDDVPLTRGYIIEDNGRIGRVEREQAYAPGWTAAAHPRALFLSIAPDGIVPASLRIVDIAVLGQYNAPLQGMCPFVTLAFEQTVGPIRIWGSMACPTICVTNMPGAEDPTGRHTEPHLRFYFLALNKGTGHCVQIEEWYTGFIFVSRSRVDLVDACRSALPLHALGALLAEVSDSRRRNERRVIRSTSLSGLVQRIVDLENALRPGSVSLAAASDGWGGWPGMQVSRIKTTSGRVRP